MINIFNCWLKFNLFKNFFLIIGTALVILSCGGSSMEKDAKESAEVLWQLKQLDVRIKSGDNSFSKEYAKVDLKLNLLNKKFTEKYGENNKAFSDLILKYLQEKTDTPSSEVENSAPSEVKKNDSATNELIESTKKILVFNSFTLMMSVTSFVMFTFDDTHFIFRVLAIDGTELSRANGPYSILPPTDGSLARIKITIEGPIQKSPMYADKEGIDTELFLRFNRELLLKLPSQELVSKYPNAMLFEKTVPPYFLVGRDCFNAKKLLTQAERDSIDNVNRKKEEMKNALEEKLKGLN